MLPFEVCFPSEVAFLLRLELVLAGGVLSKTESICKQSSKAQYASNEADEDEILHFRLNNALVIDISITLNTSAEY